MKAAVFHEHGPPDVLRIEDVEDPRPSPGEVLLRVGAASMNHLDLWVRRGLPIEIRMPHIGGSDVAGEVVELGEGVEGEWLGRRVVVDPSLSCGVCHWCQVGEHSLCERYRILGEHTNGGFAELLTVPATNLFPIPDTLAFEQAAAAPLAFLTAWRGLMTRGRLQAGEAVLVTGASGGVATAAIQIARLAGARVFAVTTGENVDRVRGLGADVVYDRTTTQFEEEVWAATERRGVDVAFDSVGAAIWKQTLRTLGRKARMVIYGATTGPRVELDLRQLFWKQLEVLGTTMSNREEFRTVMELVAAGKLRPVVDVVWPLERIREAHERLEAGGQFGKLVLTP